MLATLAVVAICYRWVDRPVAFYVHDHAISQCRLFKWLTYPPPWMEAWSPLILALAMLRRARGPWSRWLQTLFVACLSLIVADEFRESIGALSGRFWPESWHDDNPSLIGTGAYGFQWFAAGADAGSFPSGHSARIGGFASVWWIALPRTRAACVALALPMLLSLVAMNYHFVSDVVAGSALGCIVGMYAARLADLADDGQWRNSL
jgi:membrane-associated phospholipid phosphatase